MDGELFALVSVVASAYCYAHAAAWPDSAALAWLAPGILMIGLRRVRDMHAALLGVLYATIVGAAVAEGQGPIPVPVTVASVLGLGASMGAWLLYGAVPFAVLGLAFALLARRLPAAAHSSLAAWLWVGAELCRTTVFGVMPWTPLGATQSHHGLLAQIAELGGPYAVSFVMALISTAGLDLLFDLTTTRRRPLFVVRRVALPGLVLLTVVMYGVSAQQLRATSLRRGEQPVAFVQNAIFHLPER